MVTRPSFTLNSGIKSPCNLCLSDISRPERDDSSMSFGYEEHLLDSGGVTSRLGIDNMRLDHLRVHFDGSFVNRMGDFRAHVRNLVNLIGSNKKIIFVLDRFPGFSSLVYENQSKTRFEDKALVGKLMTTWVRFIEHLYKFDVGFESLGFMILYRPFSTSALWNPIVSEWLSLMETVIHPSSAFFVPQCDWTDSSSIKDLVFPVPVNFTPALSFFEPIGFTHYGCMPMLFPEITKPDFFRTIPTDPHAIPQLNEDYEYGCTHYQQEWDKPLSYEGVTQRLDDVYNWARNVGYPKPHLMDFGCTCVVRQEHRSYYLNTIVKAARKNGDGFTYTNHFDPFNGLFPHSISTSTNSSAAFVEKYCHRLFGTFLGARLFDTLQQTREFQKPDTSIARLFQSYVS